MVDLIVAIASVLQLILDKTGAMGNLRVLRAFQPLKVVTASRSLREVSRASVCVRVWVKLLKAPYLDASYHASHTPTLLTPR